MYPHRSSDNQNKCELMRAPRRAPGPASGPFDMVRDPASTQGTGVRRGDRFAIVVLEQALSLPASSHYGYKSLGGSYVPR